MRRIAALIFLLSLSVRLTLLFGFHRYELGRYEAVRIAMSVAAHGAFANPYAVPTGPTAHTGPIYPAMIAPFYLIWDGTPSADLARFSFNAVAASAGYALLPALAGALGMGWIAGAAAGLFGAVVPLHHWVECVNGFENSWTGLFLEVATLWLMRLLGAPPPGARAGVAAGGLWGFGLLLAPAVAPVLAAYLAIAAARRRCTLRWAAALAGTLAALLLPWTIRNWVQLGGVVFVRDNLGLELTVSNRDGAGALAEPNPAATEAHPFTSVAVAREVQQMGELPFERRCLREALRWIRAHPGAFARLTAERFELFWLPAAPRFRWAMSSVSLLAGFGLLLFWRRRRTAAVVLAALLASYSAFFYFIQSTLRYQHPIWWALLLLAAWPFASLGYTKRLRFSPNATEHPVPSRPLA